MRFNEDNRRSKPGRGEGAGRDGRSFDKNKSGSGPRDSRNSGSKSFDKPKFGKSYESRGEGKSFGEKRYEGGEARAPRSFDKPKYNNDYKGNRSEGRDSRGGSEYKPRFGGDNSRGEKRSFNPNFRSNKPEGRFDNDRGEDFKPRLVKRSEQSEGGERRSSYPKHQNLESYSETRFDGNRSMRPRKSSDNYDPNAKYSKKKQLEFGKNSVDPMQPMRLNKFLANSGLCSRREADEYIKAGVVTVNGEVISELGAKVIPATDRVLFHDQLVRSERKVYILLNKPKDCVTTTEDTNARLTVMDLVKNACSERIYPVGRLDRNTTGVLLLTNDGDMAAKLMHPKYNKKKIYHVHVDKPVTKAHLQEILDGITLEDGPISADAVDYVTEDDKKEVGIEIHSGRNRLVRRIFEHFGYKVMRLDRVYFAGLTKKNLSRGQWRFLTEKEINILRMGAYE